MGIKYFPLASGRGDGIVAAMDSQNTPPGRTKVSGSAIYPDYWTQGQSLEDLESHLRDLYQDLTSGEIPGVRKLANQSLRR